VIVFSVAFGSMVRNSLLVAVESRQSLGFFDPTIVTVLRGRLSPTPSFKGPTHHVSGSQHSEALMSVFGNDRPKKDNKTQLNEGLVLAKIEVFVNGLSHIFVFRYLLTKISLFSFIKDPVPWNQLLAPSLESSPPP